MILLWILQKCFLYKQKLIFSIRDQNFGYYMYIQVYIDVLQMAPDYDHLTLMQKVEVFEHALEHTQGDDLAKILWYKSPSSEVKHTVSCFVVVNRTPMVNNFKTQFNKCQRNVKVCAS